MGDPGRHVTERAAVALPPPELVSEADVFLARGLALPVHSLVADLVRSGVAGRAGLAEAVVWRRLPALPDFAVSRARWASLLVVDAARPGGPCTLLARVGMTLAVWKIRGWADDQALTTVA